MTAQQEVFVFCKETKERIEKLVQLVDKATMPVEEGRFIYHNLERLHTEIDSFQALVTSYMEERPR